MKSHGKTLLQFGRIVLGCTLFGLGFNMFLLPNELNAGGISGLSMAFVYLTGFGTVGSLVVLFNLPLFAAAGLKVGKKFFYLSLVGTFTGSLLLDVMALLPAPATDPLIGSLYGGLFCGLGLGTVFSAGGSTGGSDIIIRLLKQKWRAVPIGTLAIIFDMAVAVFTGLVFGDFTKTLYSGIAVFVSGQVIDSVLYRFDYSRVVWIVTRKHAEVANEIAKRLSRGATFLHGEGSFSHRETMVVMTAVRRQQLPQLKQAVSNVDENAFVIVQEAHQVLGDGFLHYSPDSL